MPVRMIYRKYQEAQNTYLYHKGILGTSELPKKLTLNKLALIGEAEKSP